MAQATLNRIHHTLPKINPVRPAHENLPG